MSHQLSSLRWLLQIYEKNVMVPIELILFLGHPLKFFCDDCGQCFQLTSSAAPLPVQLKVECGECFSIFSLQNPKGLQSNPHKPERRIAIMGESRDIILLAHALSAPDPVYCRGESEQQTYIFTTIVLDEKAPFGLLTGDAGCFDAIICVAGENVFSFAGRRWLDGMPLLVLLSGTDDHREILWRQTLETEGLSANEIRFLRGEPMLRDIFSFLDEKVQGASLVTDKLFWARPLPQERQERKNIGYEEYMGDLVTQVDEPSQVFQGALLWSRLERLGSRCGRFTASLTCFHEPEARIFRETVNDKLPTAATVSWGVRWPFEEGRPWANFLQKVEDSFWALQCSAIMRVTLEKEPFGFVAELEMLPHLRMYPGLIFLLSYKTQTGQFYALGRVLSAL